MTHALTLAHVPSAAGSLEAYIQAAHRVPMLTEAEELMLARRFRDEEDLDAARQLVLSHLRLVVSVARGYLGYGLPHADLIQEGNIGLMKAVKRFDPERGVRLVSFAMHWIKAEIHEYVIRNWRLVKIATTKAQRKLFFNLRGLKKGFNALSVQEAQAIAKTLGVKPEEVVEMETRLTGADVSLEPTTDSDDEAAEHFAPIAYLATDVHLEPSAQLERKQADRLQDAGLQSALSGLDDRSRTIICRRWLIEEGKEAATLHELAAEYNVSAERIRQIEVKAMQKMKGVLADYA
ncbi:MAG: RNA polymerase sigma factor RpoH [Rhodocyclaceae bacterium]|nr:RNA polymerase sigma factor RpoH [Rhodocyclaceae bacterium]